MTSKANRLRLSGVYAVVAGLLFLIFLQLSLSIQQESISWDEGDHLFSGYMSWKHGDFGLNPEHPPLVKMVAALPLLGMPLDVPTLQGRQFKIEAFLSGKDFAARNYGQGILFRARMAASVFTLLLGLLVFLGAREMFGTAAGLIALGLFAFDPNILAHGALVTTDMGVSCFMFGAIYAFYRCVKSPSAGRLLLAGLATGCALGSKHTGVLLFPMLLVLVLFEVGMEMVRGRRKRADTGSAWKRTSLRILGMYVFVVLLGVVILWSFYGFRYRARPAGLAINPPMAEALRQVSKPSEVKVIGTLARFRVLPESYLYGMADIQAVNDTYTSYFFGKVYPHGTRLYFPGVLAIKSTLPFLLLLLGSAIAIAAGKLKCWREIVYLTVPPVIYLIVAMSSQMNIGVRHILPMYPFLYVLGAGAAAVLIRKDKRWWYAAAVLILWQAVAAVRNYPVYMAYANELWGGPANTHKYLSDSNVDWGQQLLAVKQYLDERGIKNCWFVYFAEGPTNANSYGIPCKPLPITETLWWLNEPLDVPAVIDGPVLISAGDLSGFEFGPAPLNPYEQFKSVPPVATIQQGVYVYEGRFAIPLASSYAHAQKGQNFLDARHPELALAEARQAVSLAPDAVFPNTVLGDVLTALKRPEEAHPYFIKALDLAKTVQPEFQQGSIPALEQKLAGK